MTDATPHPITPRGVTLVPSASTTIDPTQNTDGVVSAEAVSAGENEDARRPSSADSSRRRLSDQGRGLLREALRSTTDDDLPHPPLADPQEPHAQIIQSGRKTVVQHSSNYHAEIDSDDDGNCFEVAETKVDGPSRQYLHESRLELATTEQPFSPLQNPLFNPVDHSQVVPSSDKTFSNVPYIDVFIWRNEDTDSAETNSPVHAIRRSFAASRKSFYNATEALASMSISESGLGEVTGRLQDRRRVSEKRLAEQSRLAQEAVDEGDRAKQGLGSDYTMFNRDWSVLLRAKRAGARWNQVINRQKHSDLEVFVGPHSDIPVAIIRGGARASRLLLVERVADGGIVYTIAKEKVEGYRMFWIAEGKRPNGVDPADCRFLLIPRKGRLVLKSRADVIPVRHLSSSSKFANQQSLSMTFNATVMDFLDKSGSKIHIASGLDLILAFVCLIIGDRFERYNNFAVDDEVRTRSLHNRFETGIGEEMDVFQRAFQGDAHGSTNAANSLLY